MGTVKYPRISVVVPVFNVEEYVEQCLSCLQNQTLKCIEIIAVDDGSTDTSGLICDKYANQDPRFTVIHKDNQGLSAARNDALLVAKGDYVMFLDADDWAEPEFCELPLRVAEETDSELVVFLRIWHKKDTKSGVEKATRQDPFPLDGIVIKESILTELWPLVGVVSWNKLYKRSLFEDIRFPVGRLSEDTAVTHRVIQKANKVCLLNRYLYHHRISRPGSIMYERSDKMIADEAYYNMIRTSELRQWGYFHEAEEEKQALLYLMKMGRKAELSDYCKRILQECTGFAGISVSRKMKAAFKVYKFSPLLFEAVLHLKKRRKKR